MTYAADGQALGAAADAELAVSAQKLADSQAMLVAATQQLDSQKASNLALTASLADAEATIVVLNAKIAELEGGSPPPPPPPPPPPVQTTVIGTTAGSLGIVKSVAALPKCQVVRSYQSGQPTTIAKDADLTFAKTKGLEVWYVFGGMPTQAAFQTCVADWIASGLTFRWTLQNEVDKSTVPAATFVKQYDQLQVWAEAVPGYQASKVRDQTGFTSYMLIPSHPHGDPATWVPTRPTRLGFDCYVQAQFPMIIAFAKVRGLPWAVPEMGAGGAGGEGGSGDAAALSWAQKAVASWVSYPPQGACWYASTQGGNARSDTLVNLPKTASYLSSLIP